MYIILTVGNSNLHYALKFKTILPDASGFIYELKRLEFDTRSIWRVSEINSKFEACSSYPKFHIVPAWTSDKDLTESARFRSNGRFPSVVWRDIQNGAVLARCSQPEVGLLGWRCNEDEKLLSSIARSALLNSWAHVPLATETDNAMKPLLIIDARSYTAAFANRAKGGGFEYQEYYADCQVQFMSLPNIHGIRKSFHNVRSLCQFGQDQANWLSSLEATRWLQFVSVLLRSATVIVNAIQKEEQSVLVHCSDGWDRTAQLVSLSELLMDPFYRTVKGFQILIEREWLDFGHKFGDRCGHSSERDVNERSPVFLQWLDCVYQLLRQFPAAFEFNNNLLVKLAVHTYSCLYGTFLCNNSKERQELKVRQNTTSFWSLYKSSRAEFRNLLYLPEHKYCKFHDPYSIPGFISEIPSPSFSTVGAGLHVGVSEVLRLVDGEEIQVGIHDSGHFTGDMLSVSATEGKNKRPTKGDGNDNDDDGYNENGDEGCDFNMHQNNSRNGTVTKCNGNETSCGNDDGLVMHVKCDERVEKCTDDVTVDKEDANKNRKDASRNKEDAIKKKKSTKHKNNNARRSKSDVKRVNGDAKMNRGEIMKSKSDTTANRDNVGTNEDDTRKNQDKTMKTDDDVNVDDKATNNDDTANGDESEHDNNVNVANDYCDEKACCEENNGVDDNESVGSMLASSVNTMDTMQSSTTSSTRTITDSGTVRGAVKTDENSISEPTTPVKSRFKGGHRRTHSSDGSPIKAVVKTASYTEGVSSSPYYGKAGKKPTSLNCLDNLALICKFLSSDGLLRPDDVLQYRMQQLDADHKAEVRKLRKRIEMECQARLAITSKKDEDQFGTSPGRMSDIVDEMLSLPDSTGCEARSLSSISNEESWENVYYEDAQATKWVPDHIANRCGSCDAQFGLVVRKHHCRKCGNVFCSSCSDKYLPVPDEHLYDPVRVCVKCYEKHSHSQLFHHHHHN
eukprot:gene13826-15269_t